jgi:hypothetical protein
VAACGLSLVLASALGACHPIGIAEDYLVALVRIYNRTLAVISYDGGWVPICAMGSHNGLPPWPPASPSAPPDAVRVAFDLAVPADFKGEISVVVSDRGVSVTRGAIDERDLPSCAGKPGGSPSPSPG